MQFDLAITNGTVATAGDIVRCDVGIKDGKVAALGSGFTGQEAIDASGKLVLPGGIDSHVHIDEPPFYGVRSVDEMTAMAKAGDGDLFALSRDAFATLLPALPGARVLDGGFQHTGIASAVPRGRAAALKIFGDFVERAKKSGVVRRALDKAGFTDAEIWDIAAVAAFFNMSDRMASAVDLMPNREYHFRARAEPGAAPG